jgi:hypothetical protein
LACLNTRECKGLRPGQHSWACGGRLALLLRLRLRAEEVENLTGSMPAYGRCVKQTVLIIFELQQLRVRQADSPRKDCHIKPGSQAQGSQLLAGYAFMHGQCLQQRVGPTRGLDLSNVSLAAGGWCGPRLNKS